MNRELPDVQARFRKGRGTRNQIANTWWIIEKAREFQKDIYFCFIDYAKAFDCVGHNKLRKIHPEIRTPDHLTYFLRNLYADQMVTVRTGHETTDWFQIEKGICQGCKFSPRLFNLYADYIRWNDKLDEAQAGIKIAGRNINKLRYADDTTLMAESEEELKRLLMKVKEESEKDCLKLNIQGRWEGGSRWGTHVNLWLIHVNVWQKPLQYCKIISLQLIKVKKTKTKTQHSENQDHGIWSHQFMANRWRNNVNSERLYFRGLQNHCRWWLPPWI